MNKIYYRIESKNRINLIVPQIYNNIITYNNNNNNNKERKKQRNKRKNLFLIIEFLFVC
jgi:hypothetical protein